MSRALDKKHSIMRKLTMRLFYADTKIHQHRLNHDNSHRRAKRLSVKPTNQRPCPKTAAGAKQAAFLLTGLASPFQGASLLLQGQGRNPAQRPTHPAGPSQSEPRRLTSSAPLNLGSIQSQGPYHQPKDSTKTFKTRRRKLQSQP